MTSTRLLACTAFLAMVFSVSAQSRIDGTFPFQTDTAKMYSIYVPSGYVPGTANRLMLGLHPLNTNRWNSVSWCDTLIVFAETNNVLLVCPDGGADGAIDDPIDTAFTTALLDSVYAWYSVDMDKRYAMGFSWGARTTYTYGLLRPEVFNGYLPIGAAINGTSEVNTTMQQNSADKPVYIVHGANDSPNTRFYPVRDALIASNAIVESLLMPGVGHTIDFPDRNSILTTAFQWIDSVNCSNLTTGVPSLNDQGAQFMMNTVVLSGGKLTITTKLQGPGKVALELVDMRGAAVHAAERVLPSGENTSDWEIPQLNRGTYVVRLSGAIQGARRVVMMDR